MPMEIILAVELDTYWTKGVARREQTRDRYVAQYCMVEDALRGALDARFDLCVSTEEELRSDIAWKTSTISVIVADVPDIVLFEIGPRYVADDRGGELLMVQFLKTGTNYLPEDLPWAMDDAVEIIERSYALQSTVGRIRAATQARSESVEASQGHKSGTPKSYRPSASSMPGRKWLSASVASVGGMMLLYFM
jgi:hypothetical protein